MKFLYLFYLIYYISLGIFNPFTNVYYERLGFSGSQIGLISSVGLLFAMVLTPLWGVFADKTRRYRTLLAGVMILSAVSAFIWKQQTTFLNMLVVATFLMVFRSAINPIADSLSVSYCASTNQDYGKIRGIGSLGYVLGSFVIVNCLDALGFQGPYVSIMCLCLILPCIILKFYPQITMSTKKEKVSLIKNGKILLQNKAYVFIICLMLFSNLVMDSAGAYLGNHLVTTLHASEGMIGVYSLIAALPEVIFIMMIGHFVGMYGFKKVYFFSLLGQLIRLIGYACVNSVPLFMVFSVLNMLTTGIGAVVNMNYIQKVVDSSMLATAVSLYTGIYFIGQAVYTQLFGFVYQWQGSHMIFMIGAGLTLISIVMVIKTKQFDFHK